MRLFLILLYIFFIGTESVFAFDLVLPKEKKSYVNTKYAFFVGKANKTEEISINHEKVYIAPNGAFAHSIKLKDGENRIIVKSNFNTQVYKFYKHHETKFIENKLIEFSPMLYKIKKDNTPLRNTPIDFGMNRISHLFKDTALLIDGEENNFYRVRLAKDKIAWVSKEDVKESNTKIEPQFVNIDSKTYKNASVYEIAFTENLPYTVEETDSEVIFKIYNLIYNDSSIYTINIEKPEKYVYSTHLKSGKYTFKVSSLPQQTDNSLSNLTIIVDPGHGGNEKGAIGCLGDKEKDINLKIAQNLKELLSSSGANVIMTRECDGYISLEDRVKLAKTNDANIFISIHLNSIADIKMNLNKNKGTSVYYYNKNSKDLSELVKNKIINTLKTRDDGVKTGSFAVIRPTDYIGILIEVAYMTNPHDTMIYTKDTFPIDTAKAIYEAILEYTTN